MARLVRDRFATTPLAESAVRGEVLAGLRAGPVDDARLHCGLQVPPDV